MPYYSAGNADQMEEFIATVDVSVLDRYSSLSLVKLGGDFNTQLPSRPTTPGSETRYRSKGFTKHSMILDKFMCGNGLKAINLQHKSHIVCTDFCHAVLYTAVLIMFCAHHMTQPELMCVRGSGGGYGSTLADHVRVLYMWLIKGLKHC